jgi:hypothetical protein
VAYILDDDVAFVEIPKNFSTSISFCLQKHKSIADNSHITLSQYASRHPNIRYAACVLRCPRKRFLSACNFVVQLRQVSQSTGYLKIVLEELMDAMSSKVISNELIYFYPQYSFLLSDVELFAYDIGSIGSFLEGFGVKGGAPRMNESKKIFTEQDVDSFFKQPYFQSLYAIDFRMWKMIESAPNKPLRFSNPRAFILQL